jgi:hypothetical protein
MARKAVAATLASVVLFTALVVADSTVMVAEDNVASSALTSHIESREMLMSESLAGTTSFQVLALVQSYLGRNSADCSTLPQYLASASASSSISGEETGIAYSSNATAAELQPSLLRGAGPDNLTMLAPFSGGLPGTLNLQADLRIKEIWGGGSVSLERNELHVLHLPISPDTASSLCALSLGSLAAALRSPCNSTSAQAAFDSALPRLVEEASARGFALTAGWGSGGAACSATYWVTLVELGVEGVTGSFDWTLRGSGSTA